MFKICRLSFLILSLFILVACSKIEPEQSGTLPVKEGQLFYQVFGQGDPIIVLHGGPGLDQTYLLPQMLELAKKHQVIFYDQRGSGKSLETPMTAEYLNLDQFTQDLDQIRNELGLDKVVVLGHSWGGLLGMNYAIHHPEHVSKLILMSTAPADYKGTQAFMQEFSKRTQPIMNTIHPLFDPQAFMKLSETDINQLYKKLFSVYYYQPINVELMTLHFTLDSARGGEKVRDEVTPTSLMNPHFDLHPQLKTLNIPTLVITGEKDIVPLSISEGIKNTMPDATLVVLRHSGHFPYVETPDALFREVHKFLND